MKNRKHPIEYIMNSLDGYSSKYIPVVTINYDNKYLEAIKKNLKNTNGVAIRISLSELAHPDIDKWLLRLFQILGTKEDYTDLIIDLGRPDVFTPYSDFAKLISYHLNNIGKIQKFRSLVLVSTSLHLKEIKKPGGEYDRHEWEFYRILIEDYLDDSLHLSYGDYSIEPPEFQETDFRFMKPPGKIVYTCDDIWLVSKGGAFRTNPRQMIDHCRTILNSAHFSGKDYSWGDSKIYEIAKSKTKNFGHLSTWKQVGMTHHLTKIISQISSYYGF